MTDHPDDPHGPATPPGDDFPADFFDDVPEPASEPVPEAAPNFPDLAAAEPPPPPPAPAPSPVRPASAAVPSGPIAPTPPRPVAQAAPLPASPAPEPHAPGSPFPWLLGVVSLGVLASAWFFGNSPKAPAGPAPATAPAPAVAVAAVPVPEPAHTSAPEPAPVPNEALAAEVKALREHVDSTVKSLNDRVDALPKPEPASDLKAVQGKMDELSKAVAATTPLTEKVGKLEEQVGGLGDTVKALQGELAALRDEHKKTGEAVAALAAKPAPSPAPAPAEAPKPAADPAAPLAAGANLFKAGKYKEAADAFKALAATKPEDARVYYYAALANGMSTNVWNGETETLVNQGVEREKAGTPKGPEITEAFASVPPAYKGWLDAYRQRAR